jgi:hypothetical protein
MQLDPIKQRIDRIRMEAQKFAEENGQDFFPDGPVSTLRKRHGSLAYSQAEWLYMIEIMREFSIHK